MMKANPFRCGKGRNLLTANFKPDVIFSLHPISLEIDSYNEHFVCWTSASVAV